MTATIYQFPTRKAPSKATGFIKGQEVEIPCTHEEYRSLIKRFLTAEDYADVLLSSLDPEMYASAEQRIRNVVDVYHSFWTTAK